MTRAIHTDVYTYARAGESLRGVIYLLRVTLTRARDDDRRRAHSTDHRRRSRHLGLPVPLCPLSFLRAYISRTVTVQVKKKKVVLPPSFCLRRRVPPTSTIRREDETDE